MLEKAFFRVGNSKSKPKKDKVSARQIRFLEVRGLPNYLKTKKNVILNVFFEKVCLKSALLGLAEGQLTS